MSVAAIHHDRILSIVGEAMRIVLPPQSMGDLNGPRYGDLTLVREGDGAARLAQVVKLDAGEASGQVFGGAQGLPTRASAQFLGHPRKFAFSGSIMGRVFTGAGRVVDGAPSLEQETQADIRGPFADPPLEGPDRRPTPGCEYGTSWRLDNLCDAMTRPPSS